jgi:ParB family chromosome partitioning protein
VLTVAEFDLAKLMKDVSKMDTGRQQIRYIPLGLIDPDPDNFYSLDGLEELAGSIEMLGLQQPILVRPVQGGRYMVISGHRRREALRLIAEGGSQQFADGVPCIVDAGEASEALRELKLIMANADTRKMSSADQNKQAERIEDLLRQLVDEGYVFPGRLRDWVSKLSGMSRTKLARLKVIREKLAPELLKDYSKGAMNEAVAYELAQRPVEMQRRICDAFQASRKNGDIGYMMSHYVKECAALAKSLDARKCPMDPGARCHHQDGILEKAFDGSYSYKPCRNGHCCADCRDYLHCRNRCPLLDEKAKKERARQREASKDQRAAEKAKNDAAVYAIEHVWARFGQALQREGITDEQLRKELKTGQSAWNEYETYVSKNKVEALLGSRCTDTKPNDPMPFSYGFKADDYRRLCTVADALHVSLDYLFLRDDVPDRRELPVSETDTTPQWRTGDPPADGRYLCRVKGSSADKVYEQRYIWRGGMWCQTYGKPIPSVLTVLNWWPLPAEEL